jgi:hypothetical protein
MLRLKHFEKERSARRVRRGERGWEQQKRGGGIERRERVGERGERGWRERKKKTGCNSLVKY